MSLTPLQNPSISRGSCFYIHRVRGAEAYSTQTSTASAYLSIARSIGSCFGGGFQPAAVNDVQKEG